MQLEAYRGWYLNHMPCWFEFPGVLVNAEGHHRVTILVSRQQPVSAWVDGKVTRSNALSWLVTHNRQVACQPIDRINHNAVVPPV